MRAGWLHDWHKRTRPDAWFVAAATVAALALRVVPFTARVFTSGRVLPTGDADVFYHLRRIVLATHAWPRVPDFDAWMNYPVGAHPPWAPLFDFIPATFARATGVDVEMVAVFWPPLLGALSVVPFFALVRGLFGRAPAWLATLLFALMPANVAISSLGRVDHHVAEVLLQLWVYAWLLSSLHRIERGSVVSTRESIAFGALLSACLLTWAASMLFLWVVPAATCAWLLSPRPRSSLHAAARHVAIAFALAALACVPFALRQLQRGGEPLAFYELSLFTSLECVIVAAGVGGLAFCVAPLHAGDLRSAARRSVWVVLAGVVPLVVPAVRTSLFTGLGFVARVRNPWLADISEFAPLLSTPHTRTFAIQHVGFAHLALVPLVVVLAVACVRARERTAAHWLALLWALNVTLLALMQSRFLYYAAPLVAAAPAAAIHVTRTLRSRPARALAAAFACVAIAAPWPALSFYWTPLLHGGTVPIQQIDPALLTFLGRVEAVTPPAGDVADARKQPAYAVFAPWNFGHSLIYLAHRAAVGSNFGNLFDGRDGFADEQRVYRELSDDAALAAVLRRRHCPYLVTTATTALYTIDGTASSPIAARLQIGNGADLADEPGSGRFRLIAQAPVRNASDSVSYKLFQLVNGAELVLEGGLEAELRVVARVRVGQAVFDYVRRVVVDARGDTGRVRLSYPGSYHILSGTREIGAFELPASAVERGTVVRMGRAKPVP